MEIMIKEIATNTDIYSVFKAFSQEKSVFFLDSTKDYNGDGRFSVLGVNPYLEIRGGMYLYFENEVQHCGNVWERLSELLSEHYSTNSSYLPVISGCLGYITYEAGMNLLNIDLSRFEGKEESIKLPDVHFIFYDNLIVSDNLENILFVTAAGKLNEQEASIMEIEKKILGITKVEVNHQHNKAKKFNRNLINELLNKKSSEQDNFLLSNFDGQSYEAAVSKLIDYINQGHIYIANLTQRIIGKSDLDGIEIFDILRRNSPAVYGAYGRMDGYEIISSSPESFLNIKNKKVETRPIKGTRPRGSNPDEDDAFRKELLSSEKERAELLMIVDLERNDISKVCKPFTVKVPNLYELSEHSTVFHLSALVTGELREEFNAVDCVKACFPGGSITGTPKIRAMEIINELEKSNRGIYTGCIGYFSLNGDAAFNIAIRSILKSGDKCILGVGGGITCDSDEEAEYLETIDKSVAMINAIRGVTC